MNKIFILGILSLLLVSSVSAMSINYYFHPECGHCKDIEPFMKNINNKYNNVDWSILDVSKGSYNVEGTPTLEIKTNDNRNIRLVGSYEITRYLKCELNEQSNLNCPTYSANECRSDSWFIKE